MKKILLLFLLVSVPLFAQNDYSEAGYPEETTQEEPVDSMSPEEFQELQQSYGDTPSEEDIDSQE